MRPNARKQGELGSLGAIFLFIFLRLVFGCWGFKKNPHLSIAPFEQGDTPKAPFKVHAIPLTQKLPCDQKSYITVIIFLELVSALPYILVTAKMFWLK